MSGGVSSGVPGFLGNLMSGSRKSEQSVCEMIRREIDVKTSNTLIRKNINMCTLKYKDPEIEQKVAKGQYQYQCIGSVIPFYVTI